MAIMIFSSVNAVRSAILLGLKKVIAGQVSELAVKPLALFIMLIVLLINGAELNEVEALIWTALATMLSMFVGFVLLWRNMPKLNFPKKSISADLYLSWSRSALPLALISGLYVLNQQLDIVMLGVLSGDADVGIYKVASQMGFFVIFGQQLIRPVVAPRFSEYWSRGKLYDLEKIVVFSGRVSFAIAALVTVIMIVGGEFILSCIFGDEYAKGYAALVVICIGQMINAATGSVGNLLNMCGKELQSLKALVIGLVVNVLASVVLIPILGGLGAAIGTSLSLGVWNLMLWFSVKKNIGINPAIVRVK
ncbi:hypothetical protein GCM10007421_19580 [Halopseudomonas oceani]|nr:hypothetical protein GCM10007421_19580 [Halopseudomonas oceani]